MNQQFDTNINGAIELTDTELGSIQGGNIFGDAWNAVSHAASDVGHAIGSAATATWGVLSSPGAQKVYATLGGLLAVFGGAKKLYDSTSSSQST
jgi:hypothetical protein